MNIRFETNTKAVVGARDLCWRRGGWDEATVRRGWRRPMIQTRMVSIRAPRPSTTRGRARPIRQVRGAGGKSTTGTMTRPGLKGSSPRTSSRTRAPCSQTFHPRRSTPAPPPGPHRHPTTSPPPTTSARRRGDPLPGRRARTDARARRGRSTRRTGSTTRGRPQSATARAPGRRRRRRRRQRRPPRTEAQPRRVVRVAPSSQYSPLPTVGRQVAPPLRRRLRSSVDNPTSPDKTIDRGGGEPQPSSAPGSRLGHRSSPQAQGRRWARSR